MSVFRWSEFGASYFCFEIVVHNYTGDIIMYFDI